MIPQTTDRVKRSFKQYKQQSEQLAAVYDALFTDAIYAADLDRWEDKCDRVKHCGSMLMFSRYKLPTGQLVDKLDAFGIKIDGKKMGIYQVKKNTIKYGSGGYRQEITLGHRVGQ